MPFRSIDDPALLRRLLDAVLAVEQDLDLDATLHRIVEEAVSLVDARYGALGVLDPEGRGLAAFITAGLTPEERRAIGPLPQGHGILGLLILEPHPIRLPDLREHPNSYGFPPNHPEMTSFLGVPIRVRGEVFGNLYLTDKQGSAEFSEQDETLVMALAVGAGIAIENARLHGRLRELTLFEDRERIARDLHDTVIQRLFATGLGLQGAARQAERPEVRARIIAAVDDLDETIRQIRTTIFALESPRGDTIRQSILQMAEEAGQSLGFQPSVRFHGPVDAFIVDDLAENLLATLREALSNVVKHAAATQVDVVLSVDDDISLRISDNGKGFSGEPSATGHGMGNMGTRASTFGGELTVLPRVGGGTTVLWNVPYQS